MSEADEMRAQMKEATTLGARLFRNNTARAWAGNRITHHPDSSVTIRNARPIHAGLCLGSSDLVGWMPVVVTPDMVGETVAIFTAVEIKTPRGRPSAGQVNFIDAVNRAGGFAGFSRSNADLARILAGAGNYTQ